MLRVTVDLIPNGDESCRREIARADIGNIGRGALAKYRSRVRETGVDGNRMAEIKDYPRWSASVWDLVLRVIAKALTGKEELPARPQPLEVRLYQVDGLSYVRLDEIPEPARAAFMRNLRGSACPVVERELAGCANAWDWEAFLHGKR